MAIIYTGTWSSFTQEQFEDVISHSNGILKNLHVIWDTYPGLYYSGWIFCLGEGTDTKIAAYCVTENNYACGYAGNGLTYGAYARYFNMQKCKLMTTGSAISMTSITNDGLSRIGMVIALDSTGDVCVISSKDAQDIRNGPCIVSRDDKYQIATFNGNTSDSFGQITLENIPSPWVYSPPRKLVDVYFASTNPTIGDGPVQHDNERYYCIGGGIFAKDYL